MVCSGMHAEDMSLEELVPYWNGFFKDKVFFSYSRCSICDLLFAPTFFDAQQLQQLYRQMPPNMDVVPIEALKRTQRGYYESMAKWRPHKGAFLEVGPDIGLFTEHCVNGDQFEDFWLFEPNFDVHAQLRKTVAGKKHQIIEDMFGFSHVPDSTVTAAVMIHVLDHLLDPVTTLRELRQKMKPNGKLVIVTHNEASLLARLTKSKWPAYCLQHPQIYNRTSMRILMEEAGFSVLEQSRTLNHFPASFLLKHGLWTFGLKVPYVPSLGGLLVGLRLGNMLTVASPK